MAGQRKNRSERCLGCGLHIPLCVCDREPRLDLSTRVLLVQNNHERNKPTNTGRLVHRLLLNSERIFYAVRGEAFDAAPLREEGDDYFLLFPRSGPDGEDPPVLSPEIAAARPGKRAVVVVLDGTWGQCSRMGRRIPELAEMPAYALPPGPPSHWGVREAPEASHLSTMEAVIRVIKLFEGDEPAAIMQEYFDLVTARMLFMKGKLRKPEVPEAWKRER